MCVNVCGTPARKYVFHYFLPKKPFGTGFTCHKEEIFSFDEAMHKVVEVSEVGLSWGTLLDPDGDIVVAFGKPEH